MKKYDTDGKTPLSGVELKLTFTKQDEKYTAEALKTYTPLLKEGESKIMATDANGELSWENLDQGEYTITEVKTATGHTLLKDAIHVTLPLTMTDAKAEASSCDTSKGTHDDKNGMWCFYEVLYEVTNEVSFKIPTTGGNSATCEVTIDIDETVHVSSIQLNKATLSFTQKGASETLQAIILPSNADDQSVSWTSSNSSVAKVDQNGTVTAVADGTAIITAVANDGRKAATCSVTVKIPEETEKPLEGPTEETITLEGGKEDCLEVIQGTRVTDCSKITFECIGNSDIMEYSIEKTIRYADMTITGYKEGSIQVVAKYEGTIVKRWRVIFTSDWTDYWNYIAWRNSAVNNPRPR